jgi:hypothetical protein
VARAFLSSHLGEKLIGAGHDITFALYLEVDQIFNLACPASPINYQFDPVQTTKTSVHGSMNMLGLAKRIRAEILQASTSEVYGGPEIHPQGDPARLVASFAKAERELGWTPRQSQIDFIIETALKWRDRHPPA